MCKFTSRKKSLILLQIHLKLFLYNAPDLTSEWWFFLNKTDTHIIIISLHIANIHIVLAITASKVMS